MSWNPLGPQFSSSNEGQDCKLTATKEYLWDLWNLNIVCLHLPQCWDHCPIYIYTPNIRMQFDMHTCTINIYSKTCLYPWINFSPLSDHSSVLNAISDSGLVQCPCWSSTTPLDRGKWTWYLNGRVPLSSSFTKYIGSLMVIVSQMMSIFNHPCMGETSEKVLLIRLEMSCMAVWSIGLLFYLWLAWF